MVVTQAIPGGITEAIFGIARRTTGRDYAFDGLWRLVAGGPLGED
jgi:hypothetical protein